VSVAIAREPASIGEGLRALIAGGGAFLFFTSLDLFGHENWSTPAPSLWVAGLVAVAAATVLAQPGRLAGLRSPLLAWALGFFLLTTLWGIFLIDVPGVRQVAVDRYRSLALVVAYLVLLQEPLARRAALLATAAGVVFASTVNVSEALGIVSFAETTNRVAGRSAGLYVNSNITGLTIGLGLAAVTGGVPRSWRVPLLVAGASAVALTFSRSSALAFLVLLLSLTWVGAIRPGSVARVAFVAAAALTYFGPELADHLEEAGVLNSNTWARLRLANDDSGRLAVASRTWQLFLDSPLVGSGIGSTSDWDVGVQPHNQYLLFAADHGIVGLAVLPALAVALVAGGRAALPFAAVLLVAGIFSHTLLVNRAVLVLVALLGARTGGEGDGGREAPVEAEAGG
jgi:O-antigen ligase